MREGWMEVPLGELLEIERGGSPRPIKEFITIADDGINWVKIGDTKDTTKYITKTLQKIKPSGLHKTRMVYPGDFVLSNSMSFGKPYIMGIAGAIHDGWLVLRDSHGLLDKNFLYNILGSPAVYNQFSKLAKGSTVKNLNIALVSEVKINLIPFPEQRAIVAKIESLFSDLDQGISDLKTAQAQLNIYRQAVLKKAFEGCKEVLFEDIIISSQNGISKRRGVEGVNVKVLRLADIKDFKIASSSPREIMLSDKELDKYQLYENDLIIIRVNGSINLVGRAIHVNKGNESDVWAFCDHLIRFTLDPKKCISIFYYYYFQLQKVRKFINHNMVSSAGQNTVSQGTVKSIPVPLVSKEEQHQIVREIETRLSVCDEVEGTIFQSLSTAEALRQSILKKAFEGRLLSEAELAACRAEPDWEPAAALLARIQAEKEK